MNKISEQVKELRELANWVSGIPEIDDYGDGGLSNVLRKAAGTIECLTAEPYELQQYRATGLTPRMIEELKEREKRSHRLAVQRAAEMEIEEKQKIVLLPCPFCGGAEEIKEALNFEGLFHVVCNGMKCDCPLNAGIPKWRRSIREAVDDWNRRIS